MGEKPLVSCGGAFASSSALEQETSRGIHEVLKWEVDKEVDISRETWQCWRRRSTWFTACEPGDTACKYPALQRI